MMMILRELETSSTLVVGPSAGQGVRSPRGILFWWKCMRTLFSFVEDKEELHKDPHPSSGWGRDPFLLIQKRMGPTVDLDEAKKTVATERKAPVPQA